MKVRYVGYVCLDCFIGNHLLREGKTKHSTARCTCLKGHCILLTLITFSLPLQHYLTMFGATVAIPLVLAKPMCYDNDPLTTSEIIGTIFFVSGICTILQTVLGAR